MKEYAIFVPEEATLPDGTRLEKGVYPVLSDNETYSRVPTYAVIQVGGEEKQVAFDHHSPYDEVRDDGLYPVYDDFTVAMFEEVNQLTDEQIRYRLEGLQPHEMTLSEYIDGSEDADWCWEGFPDSKEAWRSAVLSDWSQRFQTKERMDKIFYQHLANRPL